MASNSTTLYSSNYPSSSPYTLTATVVENSTNNVANTSNVTITASITSGGVYYSGYSTPKLQVAYKDNNTQSTYVTKAEEQISSITSGTPSRSVTWTGDVTHKNDGTLSVTVKAIWAYKDSGTGYAPKSGEVEVSLTMTTIPRAGTVSVSPGSATISTTNNTTVITATVSPQSSSYYHHISATCNGTSCMTAVWAEDNSNKGYIKDTNLLTALGNNLTGTVTVTVKTYATKSTSGTLIGTNTATAAVTVDTSVIKPSLTSTSIAIKTTPITSNLVAGYSTANVKFTVAGGSGTTSCTSTVTLSKGSMATATASGSGAKTLATNALASSSTDYTLTATIKAVDGRGATTTATVTATVKGYTKPAITLNAYRVDANGSTTADEAGPYVYITYSATAKSIGNNSIQSLTATYTGSVSGTLNASPSWVALAEDQGITITVAATDRVDTIAATRSVSVATFPLDLYQDGGNVGVGLGKVATSGLVSSSLNMKVEKSDASLAYMQVKNTAAAISFQISAAGNSGLYSDSQSHWLVYDDPNGITRLFDPVRLQHSSNAASYTLPVRSARVISLTRSGSVTVTIPEDLPIGYEALICLGNTTTGVTIQTSGSDAIFPPGGSAAVTSYTVPFTGAMIHLVKSQTTRWVLIENWAPLTRTATFVGWHNMVPCRCDASALYLWIGGLIITQPSSSSVYDSGTLTLVRVGQFSGALPTSSTALTISNVYQRNDGLEIVCALPSGVSGSGIVTINGTINTK